MQTDHGPTPITGETYRTEDGAGTLWLRVQVGSRVIGTPVDGPHIADGAHAEFVDSLAAAIREEAPRPTTVVWSYDDDADRSYLYQNCFAELEPSAIPADFPVRPLATIEDRAAAEDCCTCGTCGLSWDDAVSTEYTPAPSARCPFEAFHFDPDAESDRLVSLSYVVLDQYGAPLDSLYGIDIYEAEPYYVGTFPVAEPIPPMHPYQAELLEDVLMYAPETAPA